MATILITGANRGIGLELVRQLMARGDTVIAACRAASRDLDATGAEVIEGLDVTSDDSVAALAGRLEGRTIDWLVNNAGILERTALDSLDFDAMERQFRVNSLGPLRVTAALRGRLASGSKVFIVTSRMGSIDDNTSGGSYGYRMSKAAVNMAGKSLAVDLADEGIGVFLLAIAFVFSFLPTIMMPFDSSISGAETAQADRIAGLIVDDESTEMANELNLSEFNYTEDDLTAEVGLRRTNGNTVDQVNVTVEDLDGNVVSDDWTGGATYDNQSAASSARIITTTNDTTCDPACRLIVRVW